MTIDQLISLKVFHTSEQNRQIGDVRAENLRFQYQNLQSILLMKTILFVSVIFWWNFSRNLAKNYGQKSYQNSSELFLFSTGLAMCTHGMSVYPGVDRSLWPRWWLHLEFSLPGIPKNSWFTKISSGNAGRNWSARRRSAVWHSENYDDNFHAKCVISIVSLLSLTYSLDMGSSPYKYTWKYLM